jgi:hypothetical protein
MHRSILSKLGFHEKAHRVNPVLVLFCPTAVAGASSALSFDLPPGFHSHSSRVRVLGPVHDEVRGVRALQADGRPRRSAEFAQSPGQGGLGSGGRSLACSAGASSSSSSAFSVVRVVHATPLVRVRAGEARPRACGPQPRQLASWPTCLRAPPGADQSAEDPYRVRRAPGCTEPRSRASTEATHPRPW